VRGSGYGSGSISDSGPRRAVKKPSEVLASAIANEKNRAAIHETNLAKLEDETLPESERVEFARSLERDLIEAKVRDALVAGGARFEGAKTEQIAFLNCRIDIETDEEIIELKRIDTHGMMHAWGQLDTYSIARPGKRRRLAIFHESSEVPCKSHVDLAVLICKARGASLTLVKVSRADDGSAKIEETTDIPTDT
jgi:hypothetical protein